MFAPEEIGPLDPLDYLRILKRRRLLILGAVLVGAVAGYLSAPGGSTGPKESRAQVVLVANPHSRTAVNLAQVSLLVGHGDVPKTVANRLGLTDAAAAAGAVSVTNLDTQQAVSLVAKAPTADQAAKIADAFTTALLEELVKSDTTAQAKSVADAQAQVDQAQATVTSLQAKAKTDQTVATDLQDATSALSDARQTLQQLQAQPAPEAPLTPLDSATPTSVSDSGIKAPDSKKGRAALLGFFGLFIGVGGALAADRLDARLHTKGSAEEAFGVPVLAEIPPLARRHRNKRQLLAITQPSSSFVEAYRTLRTIVLLEAEGLLKEVEEAGAHPPATPTDTKRVILVTSPGGREGKTTTAAHLAVLIAETGRKVLVVSADFRRPRINEMFDRPTSPGLLDTFTGGIDAPKLGDLDLSTDIPNVYLLRSGEATRTPSSHLGEVVEIIRSARELFDVIVIDSAPLLVANDATELAQAADAVILVGRASRTTYDAAVRSAEVLRRIDAPLIGAVLINADDTPTAYSYYRYAYYGDYGERVRRVKVTRKPRYYDEAPAKWPDTAKTDAGDVRLTPPKDDLAAVGEPGPPPGPTS